LTSPEPSTRLDASWLRVELDADSKTQLMEVRAMAWEAPEFVEVRMDAEINSYQDEFGPGREEDDRF
jgi:coenzyme PQQ precursor peptide PqqA